MHLVLIMSGLLLMQFVNPKLLLIEIQEKRVEIFFVTSFTYFFFVLPNLILHNFDLNYLKKGIFLFWVQNIEFLEQLSVLILFHDQEHDQLVTFSSNHFSDFMFFQNPVKSKSVFRSGKIDHVLNLIVGIIEHTITYA